MFSDSLSTVIDPAIIAEYHQELNRFHAHEQTTLALYRKCYSVYNVLLQSRKSENRFPILKFSSLEESPLDFDNVLDNTVDYFSRHSDCSIHLLQLFPSLFADFVSDWHISQAVGFIHQIRNRTDGLSRLAPQLSAELFQRNFTFTNGIVDRVLLKLPSNTEGYSELLFSAFCSSIYRLSANEREFLGELSDHDLQETVRTYLRLVVDLVRWSSTLVGTAVPAKFDQNVINTLSVYRFDLSRIKSLLQTTRAPVLPLCPSTFVFFSENDIVLFKAISSSSDSSPVLPLEGWLTVRKIKVSVPTTDDVGDSSRITEEIEASKIVLGCVIRSVVAASPICAELSGFRETLQSCLNKAVSIVWSNAGMAVTPGENVMEAVARGNLARLGRNMMKEKWTQNQENTVRVFAPVIELFWESYLFMMKTRDSPFEVEKETRALFLVNPKWDRKELVGCDVPRLIACAIKCQVDNRQPVLAFFAVRELATHLSREMRNWNSALDIRKWLYSLVGDKEQVTALLRVFLRILVFLEKTIGDWKMWTGRNRDAVRFMNLAMPRLSQSEAFGDMATDALVNS
jgi:hypothetical protein